MERAPEQGVEVASTPHISLTRLDRVRARVVGIFPTTDSLMRMVGTLLAEQDDEWQVADRRYFSVGSMAKVDELEGGDDPTELLAAIA